MPIVFTSCGDDDDNCTICTQESIFAFSFSSDFSNDKYDISANFSANNVSEIPKVIINGEELDDFEVIIGGVYGGTNIPFSSTITYSVSLNGKTTSGSITMPDTITNVTFNDLLLNRFTTNFLVYAPEYIVKWDRIKCDYQRFQYNLNNDNESEYIDKTRERYSITDDLQTENYMSFSIYSINGNKMVAGSKPNVSGDYGSGYVRAQIRNNYSLQNYSKKLISKPQNLNNKTEFIETFQSLIK
jgi:hypothetical protein